MSTIDSKNIDIEAGSNGRLYPTMTENPALRWAFIRKVYAILTFQLLLTVGFSAAVVFVKPIPQFMQNTTPGFFIFIFVLIFPLILLWPLHVYRKHHPVNLFLLVVFTLAISFAVGLACSTSKGKVILEAGILTTAVAVSLTLYTFWAARRRHDFYFLGPFLMTSLLILIVFTLMQIFIPMGKVGSTIMGLLGAIIFSGFIIYDTYNLIKRHTYDEYVCAAVALYLDTINLFLQLLCAMGGGSNN